MKQNLRFLMLTLLCAVFSTAWGEEVTIASFSPTSNDGWTINNAEYATAGGGYYKLVSSDASIVSPSIDWSQYSNITITIGARKFGGPDATQGKISVSQGETELASYSPSGTSIASSSAMSIEPGVGPITISCLGASSGKGCGVQSIVIKGESSKASIAKLKSISPTSLTVGDAGNFTLDADFENDDHTIVWSCNDNYLSVEENGSYKAISAGTANVTVTVTPDDSDNYLGVSETFTVSVNPAPVSPVSFDFPWSEDFSSNSLDGYSVADGGTNTKLYNESTAGGTAPELLLSRDGGLFEVVINLNGNFGEMTLTFKANYDRVTVAATGGTVGTASYSNKSYTIPITVEEGTETLTLTFTNTNSSNVRVDDFNLELRKSDPNISFDEETVNVQPNDTEFTGLTLINPNNLTVTYSSSDENLAIVDESTGLVVIGENEGIVVITATFAGNSQYNAGAASYTIIIGESKGTAENPYTVAEARAAIDANFGITDVYATGIVSKIVTAYNSQYGNITYDISADGTTTGNQLRVYRGKSYNGDNFTSEDDIQVGDVVVIYGNLIKYNDVYEFAEGNKLISLVRNVKPSITVNTTSINIPTAGSDGTIEVTYTNVDPELVEIVFYEADGATTAEYNWIIAEINGNNIEYVVDENQGEARTAYLKVYGLDNDGNDVYSELITITQAAHVADFATLPFEFDGGKGDIESTAGLTQEGLDSDYNASPKLKFNTTGDWLILQFNERPGKLTFDIKGNSFSQGSTSTFKVQTSEDGVSYTDLETYTELGGTQSEEFDNLGENVRYIKWIYTEKGSSNGGNVALGNITLAKYEEQVEPDAYEFTINSLATDGTDCYATISKIGDGNWIVPAGVTASTVVVDENGKLTYPFEATAGALIPGNGAYLLKGTAGKHSFVKSSSTDVIDIGSNMLYSTEEGNFLTVGPDNGKYYFYKLARNKAGDANSIGFYWHNADGSAFTYPTGHQAYMAVPEALVNLTSSFTFDGTTGISEIKTSADVQQIYTISGVRVNGSQLTKGLYIINGKKTVIK